MADETAVTAGFLLEGACYALRQCGHLLSDAVTLCEKGSAATAVGIAAFAREELGRSRILQDLTKRADSGETITLKQVIEACHHHVEKQRKAVGSTVFRSQGGDRLGELINVKLRSNPGSPDYERASRALDELGEIDRRRAPARRHEQRMESLYVEPDQTGSSWNKPWETDPEEARHFLEHAANDYSGLREHFLREYAGRLGEDMPLPPPRWLGIK